MATPSFFSMMMRILPLTPLCLVMLSPAALADRISYTITDAETGEPLLGANVFVTETGQGASTNADGEYIVLSITPGRYTLRMSYLGYETRRIEDLRVESELGARLDIELRPADSIQGEEFVLLEDIRACARMLPAIQAMVSLRSGF